MFELTPFRSRGLSRREQFPSFGRLMEGLDDGLRTDIMETDEEYILKAELPGFKKDDIEIEVSDDLLTITATRDETVEREDENYLRRERKTGRFQRSFGLQNVNQDEIQARFEDGILDLRLPKDERNGAEHKRIDIE